LPSPNPPGVCVWLTGVSGSGKSTVTRALLPHLEARGHTISVLDVVPALAKRPGERSSEGKLLRKAFVASEIVKHGGIAVCVTVSARRQVRETARAIVGADRFVEILVEVPSEVASRRREARGRRVPVRRRLRAMARRLAASVRRRPAQGYERPEAPDVTIDGVAQTPEEGAEAILEVLHERGFLRPAPASTSPPSGRLAAAEAT
jgi:sulfate adenylyltransferase